LLGYQDEVNNMFSDGCCIDENHRNLSANDYMI
jgi:hypothetical protein